MHHAQGHAPRRHTRSNRPPAPPVPRYVEFMFIAALMGGMEFFFTLDMPTVNDLVAGFWPIGGAGLAVLLIRGVSRWVDVAFGGFIAATSFYWPLPEYSPWVAMWLGLGSVMSNVIEFSLSAMVLWWAHRRWSHANANAPVQLDSLRMAALFLLTSVVVFPVLGSVLDWAVRLTDPVNKPVDTLEFWIAWYLSEGLGHLAIVPVALAWVKPGQVFGSLRGRLLDAAAVTLVVVIVGIETVLPERETQWLSQASKHALWLPIVVWAGLRLGQGMGVTAGFVAGALALQAIAWTNRPLGEDETRLAWTLLDVQLVFGLTMSTALVVGGIGADRERDQARIERQRDRLRKLARQMIEQVDKSHHDLALQLHDGLVQDMALARTRVSDGINHPEAFGVEQARAVDALLDQAIIKSRHIVFELHPPALQKLGLAAAFRGLASSIEQQYEVMLNVTTHHAEWRASPSVEAFFYRSGREMVFNALKHGKPDRIELELDLRQNVFTMIVASDGPTFSLNRALHASDLPGGFGLYSIHEYALATGGTFTQPDPAQPRLRLSIPLSEPAHRQGGSHLQQPIRNDE